MNLFQIQQLIADNRALIVADWNLFVSVHLWLFAGLILSPARGGRRLHLLLLMPFYLAFMYMNFRAQMDNYRYFKELSELPAPTNESSEAMLLKVFQETVDLIPYVPWIYSGTAATMVACIVFFSLSGDNSGRLEILAGRPSGLR